MTAWVIQRQADKRYYTGVSTAEWCMYISGATAFFSKEDAIAEIDSQGYRLNAFLFLNLPKPKLRLVDTEEE